ncbi:MAG TPA: neocarzinostatin apoprotein domain-containing protein [Jatrophihabitantaceae bacterium]|jgi:hypothetical protein|nr:neocarzinostatin apoprotein domain-containing protein [Jatrophihabitantaceae bacterium]
MHRISVRTITCAAVGIATLVIVPIAAASAATNASARPTIVAVPNNAMVNTTIALTGSGFPAGATISVQECATKSWIAPQQPCLADNTVIVRAGAHGGFRTTMRLEICPPWPGSRSPHPTERTCFIGEPVVRGLDTERLVAPAKVVVSWP